MRQVFILVVLALFAEKAAWGQSTDQITISGFVRDAETKEPLMSVQLTEENKTYGAFSNSFGFFSLQLSPSQTPCFVVSFPGYERQKVCLDDESTFPLQIELSKERLLDTVTITDYQSQVRNPQMSLITMSPEVIEKLPALLGETDVMKALQLMPGIKMGSEGSTGLHVRGGSPDQNLMLLDDVPLYYVSHLAGLFSLFDPEALSKVNVYKGAFPARYGGRSSSVVDMRMKEGNKVKKKHGISFSPVSLKGYTEGPLLADKSSYFASARVSNFLPFSLVGNAVSADDFNAGYYFYDVYGKIAYELSEQDKVHVSVYGGEDNFYLSQNTDKIKSRISRVWGNRLGAVRWNRIWGKRVFSNLSLARTQFYYDTRSLNRFQEGGEVLRRSRMKLETGIADWIGKIDVDFYASDRQHIRFGANYTLHGFQPGYLTLLDTGEVLSSNLDVAFGDKWIRTNEFNLYVEDEIYLSNALQFNTGIAFASYQTGAAVYTSLQPRFSGRWLMSERLSLKAGYARMVQPLHLLTNSLLSMPTDVWVPATERVAPQKADQWSLGAALQLSPTLELSVEAYTKTMQDLIAYKEGSNLLNASADWENAVWTEGRGEGYGVEVLIEKKVGATTGWLGYTYAKQDLRFEQINKGAAFPYNYERRHEFALVLLHTFNKRISFSGIWNISSGRPFTSASGFYGVNAYSPSWWRDAGGFPPDFYNAEYYSSRNNSRFPAYHRLDFSLAFTKKKKKHTRIFSMGLYNAYNQKNPFLFLYLDEGQGEVELKKFTLFPLLPNISWKFNFQ